jgi:hypothetical protein
LIFGCRTLAGFKGAGFLIFEVFSPQADSGALFLCALNISVSQEKNRTLHKDGEECGTQPTVPFHKEL